MYIKRGREESRPTPGPTGRKEKPLLLLRLKESVKRKGGINANLANRNEKAGKLNRLFRKDTFFVFKSTEFT